MPYHVRITHKSSLRRSRDTLALDKSEEWLAEQIVGPRNRGQPMFISGMVVEWDDVDEIHITQTDASSTDLLPSIREMRRSKGGYAAIPDEWYVARDGRDVTELFLVGPPGKEETSMEHPAPAENPTQVMVVHGQDQDAASAMFDWLRAIGLRPREWSQLVRATESASPFIGDVLETAFRESQAVVVLFTPDEFVSLRPEISGADLAWRSQARPNVLFEAGMALASHPSRTILVVLGPQQLPSDLSGRHYVQLHDTAGLKEVAQRLETAGCPVDLTGSDWLDAQRFPNRSDVQAIPPGSSPSESSLSSERRRAYSALLTAHAQVVQAYSGPRIYNGQIRTARSQFDQAQSDVIVVAGDSVREAAEDLRQAWLPREQGIYMGRAWEPDLERARAAFLAAVRAEGSP